MKKNYKTLIGSSKKEIEEKIGNTDRFFKSGDIWIYIIKKSWYGLQTIMYIYFEQEMVCNIRIIKKLKWTDLIK